MSRLKTVRVNPQAQAQIQTLLEQNKAAFVNLHFQIVQTDFSTGRALTWIQTEKETGRLAVLRLGNELLAKLHNTFPTKIDKSDLSRSGDRIIGVSKEGFVVVESVWVAIHLKGSECILAQWEDTILEVPAG